MINVFHKDIKIGDRTVSIDAEGADNFFLWENGKVLRFHDLNEQDKSTIREVIDTHFFFRAAQKGWAE